MIAYFIYIGIGGLIIGVIHAHIESRIAKPLNCPNAQMERLFYRTPEENKRRDKIIRRQSLYRTVLANVALVSLVLVLYWLCL